MAPLFKNCRSTTANLSTPGKPWAAGEVRQVTDQLAAELTRVGGFRKATEAELEAWQAAQAKADAADPSLYLCGWCERPYKTAAGRDKHEADKHHEEED